MAWEVSSGRHIFRKVPTLVIFQISMSADGSSHFWKPLPENKWNVEKIQKFLYQYEDMILSMKTSSTPSSDTILWFLEISGSFSTKTRYSIGMTADKPMIADDNSVNWLKHIWDVKTSPKLKDFLWRVVKKRHTRQLQFWEERIFEFYFQKVWSKWGWYPRFPQMSNQGGNMELHSGDFKTNKIYFFLWGTS